MARFIGSNMQNGNWAEDLIIKRLVDYLDDSVIIYRNRPLLGAEFDVCVLLPNKGILILEVKGWKPETIKEVRNGDSIIIKTVDENTGGEREVEENPSSQGRGYVFKMKSKIRKKTGSNPFVYNMTCFPNLTKLDYDAKGLETVCEFDDTILKDDLVDKRALLHKMQLSLDNREQARKYYDSFDEELFFKTRQIFESNLECTNEEKIVDNDSVVKFAKNAYSRLAYIPNDVNALKHIRRLSKQYGLGTKLYLFVNDLHVLEYIKECINGVLLSKGLKNDEDNLTIDFNNTIDIENKSSCFFSVFNCSAYYIPKIKHDVKYFEILDGVVDMPFQKDFLKAMDGCCNFNYAQYKIEHSTIDSNIIVRAGAGTGKTYTMISRIAFISHMLDCSMKELADRIVMITFTNDAANQMEEKIKKHFNNYYLLTGDSDYLDFINQIEGMQISTIHSYAKRIISRLGIEFGYGTDIAISSSDYEIKKIISDSVDEFISSKGDVEYIKKIKMPVYSIVNNIKDIIVKLCNQSVNLAELQASCFGVPFLGNENVEFNELVKNVIVSVAQKIGIASKDNNIVYLNGMMACLSACLKNKANRDRLIRMQTDNLKFMFIDEFQDTDDVQIDALRSIAQLLKYRLFVVGDVKQCIYRFRGAKENAFEHLDYQGNKGWKIYTLVKNYRTDSRLLDIYHNTFQYMGSRIVDGEALLIYGTTGTGEGSRLIGTKDLNGNNISTLFYKSIHIQNEEERMDALFEEINRQKDLINDIETKSGKKLKGNAREIAILVRENWEAETIRNEGKIRNINIITNTGGDLYKSEPALDMLTIVNALIHYDEAAYLLAFLGSNFTANGIVKTDLYSNMYNQRADRRYAAFHDSQSVLLQKNIDDKLKDLVSGFDAKEDWNSWQNIILKLRTMPVFQVLRKLYYIFKPWNNFSKGDIYRQYEYHLNVELLFEELTRTVNADAISISSLASVLKNNIVARKNVDKRVPEGRDDDSSSNIVIKCITVHKSKGLEYGAVILPFCSYRIDIMKRSFINVSVANDGHNVKVGYKINSNYDHTKIHYQNNNFDETLEINERTREEARILYVAMTRAIRNFSWICLDSSSNESWQKLIREEK